MDVGFLLFLNFLTIPLLYEAEVLGSEIKKFPRFLDLIQLRKARSGHWLWAYCIFLLIFLLLILTPSASGRSYSTFSFSLFLVLPIQAGLWVFVRYRIFKSKS